MAIVWQPSLNASASVRPASSSHNQVSLLSLSGNATGPEDVAGVAADRAFDDHLLETRMLLEAAASEQTNTTPATPLAARTS